MTNPEHTSDEIAASSEKQYLGSAVALIRAHAAVRPRDIAFVACAAATIVLWSAGISRGQFAAIALAWCCAWMWWFARRPRTVWAPIIAIAVTATILNQQVPDVAFAASSDCLDRVADAKLVGRADDWSDIGLRNVWSAERWRTNTVPGKCGLIRWRDTYVVEAATPIGSVVVFPAAGQSRHFGLLDIEQHGLIRVEGLPPTSCSEFLGDVRGDATCNIGDLGDGWYWFSNWWDPGAT